MANQLLELETQQSVESRTVYRRKQFRIECNAQSALILAEGAQNQQSEPGDIQGSSSSQLPRIPVTWCFINIATHIKYVAGEQPSC